MITRIARLKQFFTRAGAVDWDAVFAAELPRVYNFFRYQGVTDPAAEDLTAVTFEKAWRARGGYRSEKSAAATWLFTIARRVLIDYFRARSPDQPLDWFENQPAAPDRWHDPQASAEHGEERERLRRCLLRLPERERDLIALKYGAEMTNRAIAKMTGLSESNVGTILNRAVNTLRSQMEDER